MDLAQSRRLSSLLQHWPRSPSHRRGISSSPHQSPVTSHLSPPMLLLLLPPHPSPSPLGPLRATSASPAARLRFSLPFLCSPLLSSPTPGPRWPPPTRAAKASGEPGQGEDAADADALLSAAELLCLAPPAICSVVCAVRLVFLPSGASAVAPPPPQLLALQYVLLVGAVAIGTLIRRRQSGRLGTAAGSGLTRGGLTGRVDKVEETVRGLVAAVAVLSRTVEKLGLRFRVLRRTMRDPISETAALARHNSEATRILAAHEDLLEKEIGAIQKVLYAMQEQQQKQLDLILAIGEASRILDGEQASLDEDSARSSSASSDPELKNKQLETESKAVTGGNNYP